MLLGNWRSHPPAVKPNPLIHVKRRGKREEERRKRMKREGKREGKERKRNGEKEKKGRGRNA